ncbi:hypothetical protein VM1G_01289 [Cytospora mali]|uniref:Uncharacterized protein n=1 Tax=Cytospora mali TaxID=578113 RepID=A0A194VLM7_CYTMA|nr:hypothetical protein VM1G_01289 [Valsa mali]
MKDLKCLIPGLGHLFSCQVRRGIVSKAGFPKKQGPFIPSAEQQAIVDLSRTQNVVVSARPGAGKTATAQAIVAANPTRPIAIITYSKRLQLETARRLYDHPACDVFTFHAMAGRLFKTLVSNDSTLHGIRQAGVTPVWTGKPYELVILDEMQDCTHDLFWLTCSFLSSITRAAGGRAPRIVVLGDERQAIYNFRGADSRFLSLSPLILAALSPHPWTHLPLSKSFRLSHQNAAFVNKVFLQGEEYIVGSHSGPKPLYIYGDVFNPHGIADHLVPLIHKYGPDQTAIITPAVRGNWALSELTNLLSRRHRLPVAVSISDEVNLDDDVLAGKICVSTYHQFKGNERDLVIVYGADAGYFTFFAPDLPDDRCPNATFVALTRACKQLVVLNRKENPPMPFISLPELHKTTTFINLVDDTLKDLQPVGRTEKLGLNLPQNIAVSHMARHIPDETLDGICKTHIQIRKILAPLPPEHHIKAPDKVLIRQAKRYYEAVSDLNGMAVVAAYEYALLKTLTTLGYNSNTPQLKIPTDSHGQAAWLCHKACEYEADFSGYQSRRIQMEHHVFDWLGPHLEQAKSRLKGQFQNAERLEFEVNVDKKKFEVFHPSGKESQVIEKLSGRVDIVRFDGRSASIPTKPEEGISIWEIKFVAQLSLEHAIQVCTYAYLWSIRHRAEGLPRIILFNVRNGEKWEITSCNGVSGLKSLIEDVLRAKYTTNGMPETDEFLKKCTKTLVEVQSGNYP